VAAGYIPSDISNASTLVFPLRSDGCIDDKFAYQAPARAGGAGRLGVESGMIWLMSGLTAVLLIFVGSI
jgi:hypothetical protein